MAATKAGWRVSSMVASKVASKVGRKGVRMVGCLVHLKVV